MLEENRALKERVGCLENRLEAVEASVERSNQYTRRNNMEITGIPDNIENLEGKVIEIVNSVDIDVQPEDIEACHRLPNKKHKNKKSIVRFVNRKYCVKAMQAKSKLHYCDINSLGFPEDTKLFFNENFNLYFQRLAWKCRMLKKKQKIYSFKYQNESFFLKINGSESYTKITTESDFEKMFPSFEFY